MSYQEMVIKLGDKDKREYEHKSFNIALVFPNGDRLFPDFTNPGLHIVGNQIKTQAPEGVTQVIFLSRENWLDEWEEYQTYDIS